ncbi:hypothetical protein ACFWWA_33945 [Streptomyces goshikiensis]|uniref:hypothetical protein n=1 Tax=Streptomyces goshikiensis TaxID=1942 RepID=UPI0036640E7E
MGPSARRGEAGEQEVLEAVECHLGGQRLRGAGRELGVVRVRRELLELVPGDGVGAGGRGRLGRAPSRPAAAVGAGLAQGVQQLLRRRGRPVRQGAPP